MGVMKRLATKVVLSPGSLTPDERKMVKWHRDHVREVDYVNTMVTDRYADVDGKLRRDAVRGPLVGIHDNWRKVFKVLRNKFINQISFEDSFRICYEALRACMKRRRKISPGYLYKACYRRHVDHLRSMQNCTVDIPAAYTVAYDRENEDFRIDFRDAVVKCGLSQEDYDLCHRRIIDGVTYEEIGMEMGGLHRETVRRRFMQAVGRLRQYLDGYEVPGEEADSR